MNIRVRSLMRTKQPAAAGRRWIGVWIVCLLALGAPAASQAQTERSQALHLEFKRAENAFQTGASVLEAKARLDRVLKEEPDDAEALKLRSQVLLALGRHTEALADARRAAAALPRDGEAWLVLCEAARLCGEREIAEDALDRAASQVLDDAGMHVRMSWNALELGHREKAEAFARIAIALDSRMASGYYQLARVFLSARRPDPAAEVLARGLRLEVLSADAIAADGDLKALVGHRLMAPYFK